MNINEKINHRIKHYAFAKAIKLHPIQLHEFSEEEIKNEWAELGDAHSCSYHSQFGFCTFCGADTRTAQDLFSPCELGTCGHDWC